MQSPPWILRRPSGAFPARLAQAGDLRPAAQKGATRRNRMRVVAGAFALSLAASQAPLAHSQSASDELHSVPVEYLKRIYLSCAGGAIDSQLDNGAIMRCSVAYEVLKERAFDGDFLKLLAWSQAHPIAQGGRISSSTSRGTQ